METCRIKLSPGSVDDYRKFIAVKKLPRYRIAGEFAEFPAEYADLIGVEYEKPKERKYNPIEGLFDYQRDISAIAIQKQKYAIFADCGLGKTLMMLEFARHAAKSIKRGQCVLIVSPLMVVRQTMEECKRFYGDDIPLVQVRAAGLAEWLKSGTDKFGITNYDALDIDIPPGRIGAMILDESSSLKSAYGKWGQSCINLGKGLDWKLALTGTPAPNDRIEYANHAVFLDQSPTTNSFLANYFINRGQTDNRWELKPHAIERFYRDLSHWSIFLRDPGTFGWSDNAGGPPPIHIHIHDIELTEQQIGLVYERTGTLFGTDAGGITSRTALSQIAKGNNKGESVDTLKPKVIKGLIDSFTGESKIIWCLYNHEQGLMENMFPEGESIKGETPYEKRMESIEKFKSGESKILISKPKILGFGLNLQIATRHVFSGLQDSYESFYQAIKRSNRYGSTKPLNVHIPITYIERPMIDTVLSKSSRVESDAIEQEQLFLKQRKELQNVII